VEYSGINYPYGIKNYEKLEQRKTNKKASYSFMKKIMPRRSSNMKSPRVKERKTLKKGSRTARSKVNIK